VTYCCEWVDGYGISVYISLSRYRRVNALLRTAIDRKDFFEIGHLRLRWKYGGIPQKAILVTILENHVYTHL